MPQDENIRKFGLSLALLGCQEPNLGPSYGMGDPYPAPLNDPQISLLSPELRPWIAFHPAIVTDDGEVPMQVEVPLRNMTDRQYLLDYRFLFYDENDRALEPEMGWTMVALRPRQTVRLKAGAMTTDADRYRLEVKWAR